VPSAEVSARSSALKSTKIKGVVQLNGFVSSQTAENRAVQVAEDVSGVKSVKNSKRLKQR